ncbi:RpiB/LacA/LacB family sugar-phosphate isomerase [Candidatus Woesearchaeota archaeon]|nr:RpiB/LacA/LacB family sugar-phosphate isomerase [Candidatus Woesearchaeota archaeon]
MIYLASDHAAFKLKESIKEFLKESKIEFEDIGPNEFDKEDDYPDFIIPCAEKVAQNQENKGIIMGGSGQGEAIAANKVKGIRAAVYYGGSEDIITLSKTHNNANILSLGARFLSAEDAKKAVKLWLDAEFSNEERHLRRICKIRDYEN